MELHLKEAAPWFVLAVIILAIYIYVRLKRK